MTDTSKRQVEKQTRGGGASPVLIGVLFAVATAFGGAALGVLADWINSGGVRLWLLVTLPVLFVLVLSCGSYLWWRREQRRQANGTAYLIEELGSGWTPAETREFRTRVRSQFAAMLQVPGPYALDRWEWPLDHRAKEWGARLGELVKAFLVVRHNDDELTANGLFVNAHYPVGLALGARLVTARLNMPLGVRQRPFSGRSGPVGYATSLGTRRLLEAHSFEPNDPVQELEQAYPGASVQDFKWQMGLKLSTNEELQDRVYQTPVVLLLRFTATKWGVLEYRLPDIDVTTPPDACVTNWADLSLQSGPAEVREFRLVHPAPQPGREAHTLIPWAAYPALVRAAVDWIIRQAGNSEAHPLLLGACMPQEIGIGIGIRGAGRRANEWPVNLWPMIWPTGRDPMLKDRFIVPNLNLGGCLVKAP